MGAAMASDRAPYSLSVSRRNCRTNRIASAYSSRFRWMEACFRIPIGRVRSPPRIFMSRSRFRARFISSFRNGGGALIHPPLPPAAALGAGAVPRLPRGPPAPGGWRAEHDAEGDPCGGGGGGGAGSTPPPLPPRDRVVDQPLRPLDVDADLPGGQEHRFPLFHEPREFFVQGPPVHGGRGPR